ncbi:MAG: large-conductance mechanosensitive channel protein MscL [Bacteroidales bacterium]|nr:large-conductance mechanosensitive channel protein MscL [Bacteroidales bacterium]
MKVFKEFKEFAIKGNMFDMAIGIIIGTAFNKLVSSMVKDILMPPFGYILGKVNFDQLKYTIEPAKLGANGNVVQDAIAINYGLFLQLSIDFLLIAFTIFFVIKLFNILRRKAEDPDVVTVPTPRDIELLSEIRDLLKQSNNSNS